MDLKSEYEVARNTMLEFMIMRLPNKKIIQINSIEKKVVCEHLDGNNYLDLSNCNHIAYLGIENISIFITICKKCEKDLQLNVERKLYEKAYNDLKAISNKPRQNSLKMLALALKDVIADKREKEEEELQNLHETENDETT